MLDAGITLEPDRAQLVAKLAKLPLEQWSEKDLAAYKGGMTAGTKGLPMKLVYGSDFPYQGAAEHLGASFENVGLLPSLAHGGLSNVWGAAMLPYADRDISDWPLRIETLAPHYAAALELTGLAGASDGLEKFFPLHSQSAAELRPSEQARQLLKTMEPNKEQLGAAGIYFGRSRVAVQVNSANSHEGCVYCRLCMYGCPYGYIYSSSQSVALFRKNPAFEYQGNVIVVSVREVGDEVEIAGYNRNTHQPLSWRCERVFLAAGAIPTTRILLKSLGAYDQTVHLKDSQYFLFPRMLPKRVKGASRQELHTLSQLFMEIMDADENERVAHLQIYTQSDLINDALSGTLGPLGKVFPPLLKNLQDRMLVAQGFLHSDLSPRIALKLSKGKGEDRFEIVGKENPAARPHVKKIVRKLLRQSRRIGAVPIPIMLKMAEPGRSFHSGGSFPMAKNPQGFQTDVHGILPGWKRVHAVDATVLPSVPATTITLSVMANAHRIGCEMARVSSN